MCDIGLAGVGLGAAGTAAGAVGRLQAGRAASQLAGYQAAVARNNAIVAERAAADAQHRGKLAEAQKAIETRQLIGRQRAALAANGVVVDRDTALQLTTDTAALGRLDALTIRSNAEREAYAFRQQGRQFESEATLREAAGANEKTASRTAAFTTALSGAGKVADRWYNYTREGGTASSYLPVA